MNYILRRQISNHPLLTNIKRFLILERVAINADVKQITHKMRVQYLDENDKDVSSMFNAEVKDNVIGNDREVILVDSDKNPVPNPDYDPEDSQSKEFLSKPMFDYYFDTFLPIVEESLKESLDDADNQGAFNF